MIKKFKDFILNEVSGTELVGPVGPAYGQTSIQNKTLTKNNTKVIYSDIDNNFYTLDDYNNIYNDYLKNNGSPLNGFTKDNLDKILFFLKNDKNKNQ